MFTKTKFLKEDGITLIELLIVTSLIAVLVTGFVVLLNPLQKIGQANDAKRKSDIAQLQKALDLYYQDNGRYPVSSGNFKIKDGSTEIDWNGPWKPYMSKVPADPTAGRNYVYYSSSIGNCPNNQCYYIYANLQQGGFDPQSCVKGSGIPGSACPSWSANNISNNCGGVCNYGVSSSNTSP